MCSHIFRQYTRHQCGPHPARQGRSCLNFRASVCSRPCGDVFESRTIPIRPGAAVFPLSRFPDDDWHALTKTLESFSEAWDSSPVPPLLSDFLGESGNPLRNRTAAELVKLDLECRWQRGLRRVLEDYADEVPDFAAVLTADLVLEEFQIRRAVNDPVSPAELYQRFPALADDLESLLESVRRSGPPALTQPRGTPSS